MINSSLATILMKMSDDDKNMRNKASDDDTQWDDELDIRNTAMLKTIVQKHGWPTKSLVGDKASNAAWLLVQHADHDLSFQESCLNMMKQLPVEEVSKQNVAYLEDRVRVVQGKPQLYGTQFDDPGTKFGPKAVADKPNLNKRRLAAGLSTFEEYQKLMYKTYGFPDKE